MAASKGRSFLLQMGDGTTSETFNTVGGLRSTDVTVNNENVDETTKDSGGWRDLLEGAGVRSVSFSGAGVFKDDTRGKAARTAAIAGTQGNWRVIDTDTGDYFQGTFEFSNWNQTGEHNGPMEFSGTLESSGAVTFTEV